MLWKTHIRITQEAIRQLQISISGDDYSKLKEGVLAPDNWKDYPHHYGKYEEITNYLSQARAFHINDDKPNALYNLGVALHYIQDSFTTYPSFLPKHQKWEEWIEDSNFVYDIHGTIDASIKNHSMVNYCHRVAGELSKDVYGRSDTIRIATLNGMKKDNNTIASPKVDLNLGMMASYVVAKSILGTKTNPALDARLIENLNHFEEQLRLAEITKSNELMQLVGERDKRIDDPVKSEGFIARITKWLDQRKIRSLKSKICVEYDRYHRRMHLDAIAGQYQKELCRITKEYVGWYKIYIPPLDTGIIPQELTPLQDVSNALGLGQQELRELLVKGRIPLHTIDNIELVERTAIESYMKD